MRNILRWREGEMQNGKLFRARSLLPILILDPAPLRRMTLMGRRMILAGCRMMGGTCLN